MYMRKKSGLTKVTLLVSAILHVVAFVGFAFVKFRDYQEMYAGEMGVNFVNQEQIKVMKRSLDVRPSASVTQKTPQHRPTGQKAEAKVDYRNSSDFYVESTPKVFSEVRSVRGMSMQSTGIGKPSVNLRKGMTEVMPTDVRDVRLKTAQPQLGVSGGAQLFSKVSSELAKPKVKVAVNSNNLLQKFLNDVRRKIEKNKKYPIAARDAGIEGISEVRIIILSDGRIETVDIIGSSGYDILDNAAIQSVRNSVPFPPIPEEAGKDKIEVSINLVFKIS
ncbi:TonB family protein [Candidatus Poribacteria bacterium]|nr:TonB family protein [Candidatus Poribacteria bacterium]